MTGMLTYKAMYKFCDDGVHAKVLDFPGANSSGNDLNEARRMLQSGASLASRDPLQRTNMSS